MGYIKKKSAKQEQRTAKEFGGKTQVASGAMWGAKGDVRTGSERTGSFNENDYLIENKFTDKDHYKLELKTWQKIATEALRDNFRTPLMQIDIRDTQLVLMDANTFLALELPEEVMFMCSNLTQFKSISLERDEIVQKIFSAQVAKLIFGNTIVFSEGNIRLVLMKKEDFMYYVK
jgi:hypothetical protein